MWWWHSVYWWGWIALGHLPLHLLSQWRTKQKQEWGNFLNASSCINHVPYPSPLLVSRGMSQALEQEKWREVYSCLNLRERRCLWHAACCSSHYKFTGGFPTSNRELNPNILLSERLEQPLIRLLIGLSLCFNICHLKKPTAVPKWAFLSNIQDIIRSLWKGTVLNSVINVWYYCLPNLANGFSRDLYLSNYHLKDKCLWGMHYAQSA